MVAKIQIKSEEIFPCYTYLWYFIVFSLSDFATYKCLFLMFKLIFQNVLTPLSKTVITTTQSSVLKTSNQVAAEMNRTYWIVIWMPDLYKLQQLNSLFPYFTFWIAAIESSITQSDYTHKEKENHSKYVNIIVVISLKGN